MYSRHRNKEWKLFNIIQRRHHFKDMETINPYVFDFRFISGVLFAIGCTSFLAYKIYRYFYPKQLSLKARPKQALKAKISNEDQLLWWIEVAQEQFNRGELKMAEFYSLKAINAVKNVPKYEKSLANAKMMYFAATASENINEKEKLLLRYLDNFKI